MRTRFGSLNWWLLGVIWLWGVSHTHAQTALSVPLAQPKQLRVDGDLRDWAGVRFAPLGDDDRGRLEIALAHTAEGLYVGAKVFDDTLVRSAHPDVHEDAVVVTLALPANQGFETSELWLFAGRIGQSPASAQLMAAGSHQLRGLGAAVPIVEGPAASGYLLEAFVPWSSLSHGADWPLARGAVHLHDVDRAGGPAREVPNTAPPKAGAHLPWLLFDGGPIVALRGFLDQKSLTSTTALLDWVGDVRGDARVEHVLVIGTYLVVSSTGNGFAFVDLPASRAADVRHAELRDLTGDGKAELVLRVRTRSESGERELWRVFDLRSDPARAVFAVETRAETAAGSLEANIVVAGGRAPQITVRPGRARGVTADNYTPGASPDVVAMPLPWGTWSERVYAWDGQHFALQKERANPHAVSAAPVNTQAAAAVPQPVAGTPLTVAELIQAYRTARGVAPEQAARFAQRVNLASDARPEALSLFGRECVVVGEGFRDGRNFFYFGLPARDGSDVLRLFTGDVTGDGRHELFARIRQQIGSVSREILYVYTFLGEGLAPLLTVEVSRSQAADSVVNSVTLVPQGSHVALQIGPGAAHGWSAKDYPFSREAGDGVAPLLLPWTDAPTRYEYDGHQLVPRLSKD